MTLEIGLLFALLAVMAYLFFTERIPIDLTAFLALTFLTLSGYLAPGEAFTGFASPAVITVLSIFIVSGAMLHSGLADMVGARVHAAVGGREIPLVIAIMLVTGVISAFMPNIAATAVMMPAAASIAARAGLSPSRLFMPLSFGAILGGTTTMVGTPPNILVAELLEKRGLNPFGLFDFTPVGLILLVGGTLFMVTVGRRFLPSREFDSSVTVAKDLAEVYQLHERLFSIRIPKKSRLDGMTLREAGLRSALKVQVLSILRNGRRQLAPEGNATLKAGDVLLVEGRLPDVQELVRVQGVEIEKARIGDLPWPRRGVTGVRLLLKEDSSLVGKTISEIRFRKRYGLTVVGIRRDDVMLRGHLGQETLRAGDRLLALGTRAQLNEISNEPDFEVREVGLSAVKQIQEHVFLISVSEGSPLVGTTIGSGHLGELVGLMVGGIIREGETRLTVSPDEVVQPGDRFLVAGEPSKIVSLLRLGEVELESDVGEAPIESDEVGVVEAVIAPRSNCLGRTVGELEFRDRYGLQVLAIWREGRPIRTNLEAIKLRFGDALLLQGPRKKIVQLAGEPDFLVLSRTAKAPRRTNKAPFALAGLLLMITMVIAGLQPIHVAAFTAASFVVLSGAITMEEAYRVIEWRVIFLIAALLPIGLALERTGAATLIANSVTAAAGPLGPYAVLAALVLVSSALSQGLDGAPAVVLLTPVALDTAQRMGLSPYPIMMAVSLAASAAFMTPFSHKANLLVMGAGGYRTTDYLKVGGPLTILLLAALVFLIPLFFPF